MDSPVRLVALIAVAAVIVYNAVIFYREQHPRGLPPSPPREPFLGHYRKLPTENVHLKHMEYAKELSMHLYALTLASRGT